eukprot:m.13435 g.13435  ORF g.13435 m.13435 type:complete len:207 (-) comp9730_c0_seq1:36-656(-)
MANITEVRPSTATTTATLVEDATPPVPASDIEKAKSQLAIAIKLKEEGTEFYKAKDFKKAMRKYHQGHLYSKGIGASAQDALGMLGGGGGTPSASLPKALQQEVQETHIALLNNIAAIHFNNKNYERAVTYTTDAIKKDAKNLKALLRRGRSNWALNKLQTAESDINAVLVLDPTNAQALKVRKEMDSKNKEYDTKTKAMYSNMFK